jgi:hypothetical protein
LLQKFRSARKNGAGATLNILKHPLLRALQVALS